MEDEPKPGPDQTISGVAGIVSPSAVRSPDPSCDEEYLPNSKGRWKGRTLRTTPSWLRWCIYLSYRERMSATYKDVLYDSLVVKPELSKWLNGKEYPDGSSVDKTLMALFDSIPA